MKFVFWQSRNIILKKHRNSITLFVGTRNPFICSVFLLLRTHQRKRNPRISAGNKFAKQFKIHSGGISNRIVFSRIYNFQIIHRISHHSIHWFEIQLRRELKRSSNNLEIIIRSKQKMQRFYRESYLEKGLRNRNLEPELLSGILLR